MNQEVKKKFFFTNDSKVSLFWNMIILISFVISKFTRRDFLRKEKKSKTVTSYSDYYETILQRSVAAKIVAINLYIKSIFKMYF